MFISHEITCFSSIKRVYKRKKKNLENDFMKSYIYITRLNLMLLLVLTSISVVVAARRKQRVKILQIVGLEKKSNGRRFRPETRKIESQNLKIKVARVSAQSQQNKTSVLFKKQQG